MVSRQVPRDVANKSVGEKLSPLPQWSKGASVLIILPDCRWIAIHLQSGSITVSYTTSDAADE